MPPPSSRSCDGVTDRDAAVAGWAEITGAEGATVAADVEAGLQSLADLGLVGRRATFDVPAPPVGSVAEAPEGARYGAVHSVMDWTVAFRSPQPQLLAAIDAHLGTAGVTGPANLVVDVRERPDGEVRPLRRLRVGVPPP